MKADLTRDTFNPFKHFTRVLLQQGRVQLDADWNEQAAILLRYLQALAADLIGLHGGPAENLGFTISALTTGTPPKPVSNDFHIGVGHYYVDGILCEVDPRPVLITGFSSTNPKQVQVEVWTVDSISFQKQQYLEAFDEANPSNSVPAQIADVDQTQRILTLDSNVRSFQTAAKPRVRHITTYGSQPDYPVGDKLAPGMHQVYLDVWERLITYVEDDGIREVALGGPDTATRAKIVWQVKVTPGEVCPRVQDLNDRFQPVNRGRLRAMAKQDTPSGDPCIVPPAARYRGPENQLYRVEIHRAGEAWDGKTDSAKANAATFKWSRENGSVAFPISNMATDSAAGTTTLTLENLGKDDRLTLSVGDWVEIQDDDSVLLNRAYKLLEVHAIDRMSMTVTLSGIPDSNVGQVLAKHPLLRRWEQTEGDPTEGGLQLGDDGAALIIEDADDNWLNLEDGIQIQFQKHDSGQPANRYRTGDYWLIPARTATGDVEWPTEPAIDSSGNPVTVRMALPPAGVQHHYAPLAVISVGTDGHVTVTTPLCRKQFKTLVEL